MAVRLPAGVARAWIRFLGREPVPVSGSTRGRRVWGGALLIAGLVVLAGGWWQEREMVMVPVAARSLPPGLPVGKTAVRWIRLDWRRLGPPGLRKAGTAPEGRLYTTRFVPAGSLLGSGLVSARRPAGRTRGFWVPVAAVPGPLAGLLEAGDRVEIAVGTGRAVWISPAVPVVAVSSGSTWTGGGGAGLVVAMPEPVWQAYRTRMGEEPETVVMCEP